SYTEAILLATGPDSALADQINSVDAAVDEVSASSRFRATAFASPGDGWSRFGIQVRVSTSDVWSVNASTFWDVKSDGTSRIVHQAARHYFIDNLGATVAMFSGDGAAFNKAYIKDLTAANITAGSLTS